MYSAFCMIAYNEDVVVVIELGACIHGVLILKWVLVTPIVRYHGCKQYVIRGLHLRIILRIALREILH